MNSFMSGIGGKKALRDEIVVRFPAHYSRYIEVFGGGGWVLFHKSPGRDFEVYNDFNPNLANLYRCVRDHPDELCDELRYTLNSRTDFDHIRNMLKTRTEIPDIKRAAYFYQLIRESYASGLDSFADRVFGDLDENAVRAYRNNAYDIVRKRHGVFSFEDAIEDAKTIAESEED